LTGRGLDLFTIDAFCASLASVAYLLLRVGLFCVNATRFMTTLSLCYLVLTRDLGLRLTVDCSQTHSTVLTADKHIRISLSSLFSLVYTASDLL